MKVVEGDLLECSEKVFGHQTNCKGIIGGLAKYIYQIKYPRLYFKYWKRCHSLPYPFGTSQLIKAGDKYIANIFGQDDIGTKTPTDYDKLRSALEDLKSQLISLDVFELALPYKMGAGMGGGDWEKIQSIVSETMSDKIEVTFYKK